MSVLTPKEFDAIVPPTCSITPLSRGEANRLRISDAALRAIIQRAVEDVEKMPHAETCESLTRFIHCEPCPFWTKHYCFEEKCIHGAKMGGVCPECAGSSLVPLFGPERCHSAPCNCGHDAAIERMKKGLGEK